MDEQMEIVIAVLWVLFAIVSARLLYDWVMSRYWFYKAAQYKGRKWK